MQNLNDNLYVEFLNKTFNFRSIEISRLAMTGTEQGAHDSTSGRGYINKASGYGPAAFKVIELVSDSKKNNRRMTKNHCLPKPKLI